MKSQSVKWVLLWIAVVAAVLALPGCGEKVNQEQKAALTLIAMSAKERATAFEAVRPLLKAKDGKDAADLTTFFQSHGQGLNLHAAAAADFVEALNQGSRLTGRAKDQLLAEVDTSLAVAVNFRAITKFIATTAETDAYIKAHQDALDKQAALMAKLGQMFTGPTPQ